MRGKNAFIDRIRVDKECDTAEIVRRLKNNEISIQNLNEIQKEEIYLFLKNQVLSKRSKLTSLKNRVLCNRAKYLCEKKKNIKY